MHEVSDHLLSQTRVRTGRTDLRTVETRLDALDELRLIKPTQVLRVGLQHLRYTRHLIPFRSAPKESLQLSHRLPQDGLELRWHRLSRIAQIDFVVPPVECQVMFWHVFGMKVVQFWRLIVVRADMEEL